MQMAYQDDLNWNVITRDLHVRVDGLQYTVPGKVAQLRDDTNRVIGITSPSYEVFQNESLLNLINPAVEEGLLEIVNQGVIKGGSKVFVQARMTSEFQVVGEDNRAMITLLNSHDGSSALAAGVTMTRCICSNTFASALSEFNTRLRHTSDIHDKAQDITEVMSFIDEGMKKYQQAVERLVSHRCVGSELDDIISHAYNKPAENVRATNSIRQFFRSGIGNSGVTLYDAFNAVTQYVTHDAVKDDSKRFISANFGRNAQVARNAMNYALSLV